MNPSSDTLTGPGGAPAADDPPSAGSTGPVDGPADPAAASGASGGSAEDGGVVVDRDTRVVWVDGRALELTYQEFELLAYLVENPYRVHNRTALLSAVWGPDYTGDSRTVDVHVARLRRKLGTSRRAAIETLRKVGYRYRPEPGWTPRAS